ncbi:chitin disaccharide deacetylase [Shouchella shacheensis]|uniref:chitin disaccharide deacetylase n=1 Tax=Shouchella shacheensis TaxID=1649580 RepID=UPI00073FC042|nr:chitin disaccharide deacetylase [Shouchella shacheensis]
MPTIIFNADDFGLSNAVNYGILDSYLHGVVTSTTMLVNMPGTPHAVSLAKTHSSLGVGVHLALTVGKPILKDVPSLIDDNGYFYKIAEQRDEERVNVEEVAKEWTAQIETFLDYGLQPTHLDSHHHIHSWSHLLPVVEELSNNYQLPWRNYFEQPPTGVSFITESFDDSFYQTGVNTDIVERVLQTHIGSDSIEVMCHPAYVDASLLKLSSYTMERLEEGEVLTKVTIPEGCKAQKPRS